MLVGVHVDDLVIVGVTAVILWFKDAMKSSFKMDDLGWLTQCLGVNLVFNKDGSILLHQGTYIKKLLDKFLSGECKSVQTLMLPKTSFMKADESPTPIKYPYHELVASLLEAYLRFCTSLPALSGGNNPIPIKEFIPLDVQRLLSMC